MKAMKKLLALMLALVMLFALCACGDGKSDKKDDKKDDKTSQSDKTGNEDKEGGNEDEEVDPEDVAKALAKAIAEGDVAGVLDLFAFDYEEAFKDQMFESYECDDEDEFFEELGNDYDTEIDSWKDVYAMFLEESKAELKDDFGSDYKIKTKVTDTTEMDEDEVQDVIDDILDNYGDYANEKKIKKISAALDITVKVTITGEDDEDSESISIIMVKYDGEWKVADYYFLGQEDSNNPEAPEEPEEPESPEDGETVVPLGAWYWDGLTMVINMDGTGTMTYADETMGITWKISGGNLILTNEEGETEVTTYTLDGNVLTIISEDGEKMIFTRKTASNDQPSDSKNTFDSALVGYWYMDEYTLVLEKGGVGTLYVGDSTEIEIEWATEDGVFGIKADDAESYAEYSISGNKLTLEYDDGTVEVWTQA